MIDQRGMPPQMTFHHIGLMNEVIILKPDLINRLRSMIRLAGSSGSLNLQMMGLEEIPPLLVKVSLLLSLLLSLSLLIIIIR